MSDGTPKIGDFGLAVSLCRGPLLSPSELTMGSPSYMAPELAAGRNGMLGPTVDLYAIGATLFELLTGGPPFRAATISETLEQVGNVEAVFPSLLIPGLPHNIETIALKCLRKDPDSVTARHGARRGSARAVPGRQANRSTSGTALGAGLAVDPGGIRPRPRSSLLAGLGLIGSIWQ